MRFRSHCNGAPLLGLFVGVLLSALAATSAHATDTETVLREVETCGHRVTSGRVVIRTEVNDLTDSTRNAIRHTETWFDGERVRRDQRAYRPNTLDARVRFEEYWRLWDGRRYTSVAPPHFRRATVSQRKQYRLRGSGNQAVDHALGRAWTMEQVAGWGGELVGEEAVGGLSCVRIDSPPRQVPKEATIVQRWWFAPDRAYGLVKHETDATWPREGGILRKRTVRASEEWEQLGHGVWLPRVTMQRVYMTPPGEKEELRYTERATVLSIAVNVPIPEAVFHLPIPEGTPLIPTE